ncbi:BTB/POZ protein [Rhizophagus irregularis DAOM 181602=DAOM 197198]|nr:BTB/POZ protein [Rhizophagus irregularis DAOM 181602=DAOM 197198]
MSTQFFNKLSQNYIEILNDDEYYDITIETGKDPNNNVGTLAHIKLPNISPEIFQILLKYIYGELQQFCIDCITKSPQIFKSFDVTIFSEKSLTSLIKRDDLQMKEIEIWEHVLKWGLAQNPTLVSDPDIWTDNDFKAMETTLQNCLPLIRFFSLSSEEFLQKVHPYKKLLKSQLYDELFKSYLNPNAEPIKGTEEILGGYNPFVWKSHDTGELGKTKDSFIFSFKSKNDFKNPILSHIIHHSIDIALYYHSEFGPAFNDDLCLSVEENDDLIEYNYNEDYEVFQIIKKA